MRPVSRPPCAVVALNSALRSGQRGAAIITALLVVALAAMLVTALFYRENVAIRSVENRAAIAQVRWVERATIDWARVVIAADYNNPTTRRTDHLNEVWAIPIPETRLDETTTGGLSITDSANDAFMAGQVLDAQARFNLTNLVSETTGQPDEKSIEAFMRLLSSLGLPENLAMTVTYRIMASRPQFTNNEVVPPLRVPLMRLTDLLDLPDVDPAMVDAMAPYVVILPRFTKVNLNTAMPEVIAAVLDIDLGRAQSGVRNRESRPYENVDLAIDGFGGEKTAERKALVDVQTSYFIVAGYIRYDRVESYSETLLYRQAAQANNQNPSVKVIWQQRN